MFTLKMMRCGSLDYLQYFHAILRTSFCPHLVLAFTEEAFCLVEKLSTFSLNKMKNKCKMMVFVASFKRKLLFEVNENTPEKRGEKLGR